PAAIVGLPKLGAGPHGAAPPHTPRGPPPIAVSLPHNSAAANLAPCTASGTRGSRVQRGPWWRMHHQDAPLSPGQAASKTTAALYKDYAGLRGYSAFASLTNRATTCTALRGLVPPKWAGMSARRWRSTASWRIPTLISCRKPRSAAVVACRSAGPDPGEEDVGRPVFGQRRRHGEDGGEAAASQGGQTLVFAYVVVGGLRRGAQVGGAGDMGLPPGGAAVAGVGEPHIGGQGGVAWPVVAQVVPGHPDCAVRVDRDRGLECERAHPRQRGAAPGAAAVPRRGH